MEGFTHTVELHVSIDYRNEQTDDSLRGTLTEIWQLIVSLCPGLKQVVGFPCVCEAPGRLWWCDCQQEAFLFILGLMKGLGMRTRGEGRRRGRRLDREERGDEGEWDEEWHIEDEMVGCNGRRWERSGTNYDGVYKINSFTAETLLSFLS